MPPTPRCIVLVPVAGAIEPACEDALRILERRDYLVWRLPGYTTLDAARNQMASDALAQGCDELMWISGDIVFDPDDVDKLRQHNLPIVCGLYAMKSCRQFACAFLPDTRHVAFGTNGGLTEILYGGFGFVLTRRVVYGTMQRQLQLPVCNLRFQSSVVPYFTPLIAGEGEQAWALGEDYSFCERARRCGFRIMADTSIRLWHVGSYRYGWEDAGRDGERFSDYSFQVGEPKPPVGQAFQPDVAERQAGKPDLRDGVRPAMRCTKPSSHCLLRFPASAPTASPTPPTARVCGRRWTTFAKAIGAKSQPSSCSPMIGHPANPPPHATIAVSSNTPTKTVATSPSFSKTTCASTTNCGTI